MYALKIGAQICHKCIFLYTTKSQEKDNIYEKESTWNNYFLSMYLSKNKTILVKWNVNGFLT